MVCGRSGRDPVATPVRCPQGHHRTGALPVDGVHHRAIHPARGSDRQPHPQHTGLVRAHLPRALSRRIAVVPDHRDRRPVPGPPTPHRASRHRGCDLHRRRGGRDHPPDGPRCVARVLPRVHDHPGQLPAGSHRARCGRRHRHGPIHDQAHRRPRVVDHRSDDDRRRRDGVRPSLRHDRHAWPRHRRSRHHPPDRGLTGWLPIARRTDRGSRRTRPPGDRSPRRTCAAVGCTRDGWNAHRWAPRSPARTGEGRCGLPAHQPGVAVDLVPRRASSPWLRPPRTRRARGPRHPLRRTGRPPRPRRDGRRYGGRRHGTHRHGPVLRPPDRR